MNQKLERGLCPICDDPVISATSSGNMHDLFDPKPVQMLTVLAFPVVDGEKRVALGPCQKSPTPLNREGEEAVIYFGHIRHRCATAPADVSRKDFRKV